MKDRMRRQFVRLALCLFLLGGSVAYAQSGMTDNQVIEYVQQALQQGKDQQTIAMELLAKGATQEQLLRLKSMYSGSTGASTSGSGSLTGEDSSLLGSGSRARKTTATGTEEDASEFLETSSTNVDKSMWSEDMQKTMKKRRNLTTVVTSENDVFGRNIFNIEQLTFQPNLSMATPENYRLGPGDEVIIDERGGIISKARTANGVGSAVPTAFFMVLGFILPKFNLSGTELEKTKYMCIALFCAIVGNLLFIRVYFKTKERVNIPIPPKKDKNQPSALKLIFTCKPLMLTALMGILSAARYMYQAGAVHAARYSFYIGKDLTGLSAVEQEAALQGNISLVSTVFSVASAVGMFGAMLLMPVLFKKFNYKQIIIATSLLGAVSSLIMWCIGYQHFWACVPFLVLSCVPCGAINVCAFAMIGDCLDYMEWKTGTRLTGMGSAIQSFVTKLGAALSTSFIILMYIIVDLDVGSINASVTANPLLMSHGVRNGIFSVVSLIPAISLLVCTIPMFFYNLTGDFREKMETELAAQREKKGITITD